MIVSLRHFLGWLVSSFSCREDLVLENLALRRQLLALHAQRPRRRLTALHKLFWVALRMCWSGWRQPLVLVTPRTVVNWHRAEFRLYWTWVSRIRQVAELERSLIVERVRAGLRNARAKGKRLGRPRVTVDAARIARFQAQGRSIREIADKLGHSRSLVHKT